MSEHWGVMAIGGGPGDEVSRLHPPKSFKKCKVCEEEKMVAEFIKLSSGYRHSQCDPCRKQYLSKQNKRRANLQKEKLW